METNLLIIGAGPFGLAVASQASHDRIEHLIVGKPMEFWKQNMPKGMFLRSACDWHLDPLGVHTIDCFLDSLGKTARDVEPLSLDFYLSYAEWFQQQKAIQTLPVYIQKLDRSLATEDGALLHSRATAPQGDHCVATTADGEVIKAQRVVLAPGFKHFAHVRYDLKEKLPADRFTHTSEFVDFSGAKNKRYLIIVGRASAC